MAGYKRWGPQKPTGGFGYFPPRTDIPNIQQFHRMLEAAIESQDEMYKPGLKAALALYQGYFGVFKSKED